MAINTAITTPEAAVKAQAEVKRKRSVAKALAKDGDITGARFELAEAADLDRAAAAILDPSNVLLNPLVAGRGGELVVPTKENMMDRPGLVDTANSDPDMLTAAASVARLDLVADAGALSVGVDAADTIQASKAGRGRLGHRRRPWNRQRCPQKSCPATRCSVSKIPYRWPILAFLAIRQSDGLSA
jgi:hypothetical protein